jgi:hypothetical protein
MASGKEVVQQDIFKSRVLIIPEEYRELSYIRYRVSSPEEQVSVELVFTYQRGALFSISDE